MSDETKDVAWQFAPKMFEQIGNLEEKKKNIYTQVFTFITDIAAFFVVVVSLLYEFFR